MFELKYKISDSDIKAAGKKASMRYVVMYLLCASVGLAAGIAVTVLRPNTFLFVAGIILIVMCAFLTVCALLLLFAKTTLDSIVPISDAELTVTVTHENIAVIGGKTDKTLMYEDMTGLKTLGKNIVVYFGKTRILFIKDAIVSGGDMPSLYQYIEKRAGRALPPDNGATDSENIDKTAEE